MSTNDNEAGSVPDWLLERLAAGDLPAERARALEARLAREPGGRERLAALALSDREILEAHPPAVVAADVRRQAVAAAARGRASRPFRSRWLLSIPVGAFALGAVLLAIRPGGPGTPPGDGDNIKGSSSKPSLRVYRKTGRAVERLPQGAAARAGDELQLAYLARGRRFGAVLSIDGTGRVTFHLPEQGGRSVPLEPGSEVTLPQSYQLDAAPAFERFLFVTGDAPFDADALADVIRGAKPAPSGTDAVTFTLRKEQTR